MSASFRVQALAMGREVGVDIEQERDDVEVEQLAARFFSASESQALQTFRGADRAAAFFR